MSQSNIEFIERNNKYLEKKIIEECPNSIEVTSESFSLEKKEQLKINYKLPLDKYIFVYGGNLGKPQGIDFLIRCISENENNLNSFILVVGSGTEYKKLKLFYDENHIKNSKLFNQLPKDEYENLVKSCDVGLIFLDKRFTIPNFPSRILSYMQAKMPILAATDVNTDLGKIITDGKFGYWCESDKVEEFNKLINIMCDAELTNKLGKAAFKYLNENYSVKKTHEIIMNHFST
jgi:glycosyltransferase involved in cell wall biosynthesis